MDLARKRIANEISALERCPLENCIVAPLKDDVFKWSATIRGPEQTPYQGGRFTLDICLPHDYPHQPPKVTFETKIYHCNVSSSGVVCLDILGSNWKAALTIKAVLVAISLMLRNPNPEDPYRSDIARQLKYDRAAHDAKAREWTREYAR